jgi:hypothetical protein
MGKHKGILRPLLRARSFPTQQTSTAIGVAISNQMLACGHQKSARREASLQKAKEAARQRSNSAKLLIRGSMRQNVEILSVHQRRTKWQYRRRLQILGTRSDTGLGRDGACERYGQRLAGHRQFNLSAIDLCDPCSTDRGCNRGHDFEPNARLRTPEIRSLRGIGGSNQIGQPFKERIPNNCWSCTNAIYGQMRDNGKAAKTAIIAVARRLLVRINAMMKKGTSYQT